MSPPDKTGIAYSVIIPVHNEEGAIPALFYSLKSVMDTLSRSYEIIFVDDGSTDTSARLLRGIQAGCGRVTVIFLDGRCGKSAALQAAFDNAGGEIYITLDGDGQDDPVEIPRLLRALDEGYDVVCGWRHPRRDSRRKRIASWAAGAVRRPLTGEKVHDVGCNFRVVRKNALDGVRLWGGLHRFFTAIMVKKGARIGEVKVAHRPRRHGASKFGIRGRLGEGLADLWRIRFTGIGQLARHPQAYNIKETLRARP